MAPRHNPLTIRTELRRRNNPRVAQRNTFTRGQRPNTRGFVIGGAHYAQAIRTESRRARGTVVTKRLANGLAVPCVPYLDYTVLTGSDDKFTVGTETCSANRISGGEGRERLF